MRLHYLQHVPFENPGSILLWAKEGGHRVTGTQLYLEEELPEADSFDWLVIMGGPMNIYEEEKYPWLEEEKEFIRAAIYQGKVVIGICLGGQLIADVIGGRVTKNPCREIGWYPVIFSDKAKKNPLFDYLPEAPVVFSWHGDTFSLLPPEAEVLAGNEACVNQAFCFRKKVFGFQYHMENSPQIISSLIENCGDEMVPGPYVQSGEEILSHLEYALKNNEWMHIFLTRLELLEREGKLI